MRKPPPASASCTPATTTVPVAPNPPPSPPAAPAGAAVTPGAAPGGGGAPPDGLSPRPTFEAGSVVLPPTLLTLASQVRGTTEPGTTKPCLFADLSERIRIIRE